MCINSDEPSATTKVNLEQKERLSSTLLSNSFTVSRTRKCLGRCDCLARDGRYYCRIDGVCDYDGNPCGDGLQPTIPL